MTWTLDDIRRTARYFDGWDLADAKEVAAHETGVIEIHGQALKSQQALEWSISEIERLRMTLSGAVEAYDVLLKAADTAYEHWDADRDSKVGKMLLAMGRKLSLYDAGITEAHSKMEKARLALAGVEVCDHQTTGEG